jgi:mono/diheme cytochrome c family protein
MMLLLLVDLAAKADDNEKGRALAMSLCARCHMNDGQGEKAGPMGVPGFHAIAHRPGQSVEGILAWLRSAPPMMPNHHLTQDEMYALANFILSLRR